MIMSYCHHGQATNEIGDRKKRNEIKKTNRNWKRSECTRENVETMERKLDFALNL